MTCGWLSTYRSNKSEITSEILLKFQIISSAWDTQSTTHARIFTSFMAKKLYINSIFVSSRHFICPWILYHTSLTEIPSLSLTAVTTELRVFCNDIAIWVELALALSKASTTPFRNYLQSAQFSQNCINKSANIQFLEHQENFCIFESIQEKEQSVLNLHSLSILLFSRKPKQVSLFKIIKTNTFHSKHTT